MLRVFLKFVIGVACLLIAFAVIVTAAVARPPTYLPWQTGASYQVVQGNNGSYSHNTVYAKYGWDFALPSGTGVRAAAPGMVKSAVSSCAQNNRSCNNGWGNSLLVCYGDGTCSRYGHLSAVAVTNGQSVGQAQLIGKSGSTGNSSGPHLHYQLESASSQYGLASSFVEAGVPTQGQWVTSRNQESDGRPSFSNVRVFASDTLTVTAGDQVRATVAAHYEGPASIPCGQINLGVRDDSAAAFGDWAAGYWPATPWRSANRVAAVGCEGNLDPGEDVRWDLTFRPPANMGSGTHITGTYAPVWDGVAWSNVAPFAIALRIVSAYQATWMSQSVTSLVTPGSSGVLEVVLKNTGAATWKRGEVFLGTKDDTPFPYANASWSSPNRIGLTEESVSPGETGRFTATWAVPAGEPAKQFRLYFGLVLEGKQWFAGDIGMYLPIAVGDRDHLPFTADDYDARWISQTYADGPLSKDDSTQRLKVTFRNTGQAVLFADGQHAVHLRGTRPADRGSGFVDTSASEALSAQGVRMDQDRVDPGETFSFTLPVKVATTVAPGSYNEYFRPVAEGTTWFGPDSVYWPFSVK